jgi:hypothetical protein
MKKQDFLKGEIHYKIEPKNRKTTSADKKTLKSVIVRIDKDYEMNFRMRMEIDDKQLFRYDKSQQDDEFIWKGCPEYIGDENDIYKNHPKVQYYFYNDIDYKDFIDKIGREPVRKTIWYPKRVEKVKTKGGFYATKTKVQPQYPIYIVSYKRFDTLYTILSLEELNIKEYYVIIRPTDNEPENYRKAMEEKGVKNIDDKLMIMPESFIKEEKNKGNDYSITHRNYAWNDAESKGFTHHWCLDDNIRGFFYRNAGEKLEIKNTGISFFFIEEYIKQYPNVYQAGMNYNHLVPAQGHRNVIIKNSRIYSCILNRHFDDIRWRGKYNEDTDLSIRILKQGKSTMNFQIFLCGKMATGSCKGGNMEKAYQGSGFDDKVDELIFNHPDITEKIIKYGRPHHQVDYKKFLNNDLTFTDYKLKIPKINLYV